MSSSVNVELETIIKIREAFLSLNHVSNDGLRDAQKYLSNVDTKLSEIIKRWQYNIAKLENEIRILNQQAEKAQVEYDKQCREMAAASEARRPYVGPYIQSPELLRKEASQKQKLLKDIKIKIQEAITNKAKYERARDQFLTDFKKIAKNNGSNDGNSDNDPIVASLNKLYESLDDYVKTNFTKEEKECYNQYFNRLQEFLRSQRLRQLSATEQDFEDERSM